MDVSRAINELNSRDVQRRATAAEELATCGEDIRAAAVSLARCAGEPREEVREWAVSALEEMGPPAADDRTVLCDLLQSPAEDTAYWAATLLGRLGAAGEAAVGTLVSVVDQHPSLTVKQRACWAIGKIGPPTPEARPILERAAKSDDARLKRQAQKALDTK